VEFRNRGESEMKSNDLFDFMLTITQDIAREYSRIQKRATEDPGTAGDQGEENWATLLRNWLPPTYRVVTKGRILSYAGTASPQVDVIVLRPSYPNYLLDKKLYLAGGIAAAFECKVTLKVQHIRMAIENAAEIRRCLLSRSGSPYGELHSPIIYGLLAHSHVWKGENSRPIENIGNNLWAADNEIIKHPREMLDLICVADLANWYAGKFSVFPFDKKPYPMTVYLRSLHEKEPSFPPVGAMLTVLMGRLGWEDFTIRELVSYYHAVNSKQLSQGGIYRPWDNSIFSEEVKEKIVSGAVSGSKIWDEWAEFFC
jgi:hypothetical protein